MNNNQFGKNQNNNMMNNQNNNFQNMNNMMNFQGFNNMANINQNMFNLSKSFNPIFDININNIQMGNMNNNNMNINNNAPMVNNMKMSLNPNINNFQNNMNLNNNNFNQINNKMKNPNNNNQFNNLNNNMNNKNNLNFKMNNLNMQNNMNMQSNINLSNNMNIQSNINLQNNMNIQSNMNLQNDMTNKGMNINNINNNNFQKNGQNLNNLNKNNMNNFSSNNMIMNKNNNNQNIISMNNQINKMKNINNINNLNNMNNMNNVKIMNNINNNMNKMNNLNNLNNLNNMNNLNNTNNMNNMNNANQQNNLNNVNNPNNMNNMNNVNNLNNMKNVNNMNNINQMNNLNNMNSMNKMNNVDNIRNINNNVNNINNVNNMNNNFINVNNLNNINNNVNNMNNNFNNMNNFNNANNMNNLNNQNIHNNNTNNNNNINFGGVNYDFMKNKNDKSINNDVNNINFLEEQLMSLFKSSFPNSTLQSTQSENDILSLFASGEKKCLDFINSNMPSKSMYISYISNELSNLFNNSPSIDHNITKQILLKINSIPFQSFTSTQEYYDSLNNLFGNAEIPKFLIRNDLDALEGLLKFYNRTNKTSTIIKNMANQKFESQSSKLIIDYFEKMKKSEMQPFDGVDKRYELFLLFLCKNKNIFNKKYVDVIFLNYLQWNIDSIQFYFGNNINFQGISQYIEKLNNEDTSQTDMTKTQAYIIFNNISYIFNNNIYIICNIIASFYYILFYKFKNIYKNDSKINIENTHLSVCLKNFVIFLNENCQNYSNNGINLFQLLMDLTAYDVHCLVKLENFYKEKNQNYNFNDIDSILTDNTRYQELKKSNIDTYQNDVNDGVLTLIKKNFFNKGYSKEYELYFKLQSIDKEVLSNSITILIDGADFLTYNDKFDWNQFISKFNGETNFYQLCWPNKVSDINQKNAEKRVRKLRFIAKTCGKLLAHIIFSEKFFGNFQINLVGLNYGCLLLKNCLKELRNLKTIENKRIFIKNIIFLNATINIKNEINWIEIFENLIVDKIINCYSRRDNVVEFLKKFGLNFNIIGTQGLSINNFGKNYVKYEHDLSDFEFGKEYYDLSSPSQVSFASYNDL